MSIRRRALPLLGMAALLLVSTPTAHAATSRSVKADGTNWFWDSQQRRSPSDTTGGAHCPPGTICPDPQLALPNPHEMGALPVQVIQGEDEKVSAVLFDLSFLPPQGARIHSFKFSVVESRDNRDRSQFVSASGKTIQACLISDTWSPSEDGADEMNDAPEFDCGSAVDGERKGSDPARWHFDITGLASSWGDDPSIANGVMLVGKKPNGSSETWQIVLKGPRRNDANTDANEEKVNRDNIKTTISYTPNPEPVVAGGGFDSFAGSTGGFGFGGFESSDQTTDLSTGSDPFAPPAGDTTTPLASPFGAGVAPQAFGQEPPPGMPGYFWLLIPTALLGMAVVRQVVLEPLPGKRPDGVVALIRRQNASRLGRPASPDVKSPLEPVTRILNSAGARMRGLARKVITGGRSS